MNLLTNKYLIFVIRLVIGVVFVYASFDKIARPDQFARIIYNYHMLPGNMINVFGLILPWIELLAGVLLILGYWEKSAATVIWGLLVIFIVALAMALKRGVNIECGCFSTTARAKAPVIDLLIRDVLMLAGCFLIMLARSSFWSLDSRTAAGSRK